MKEKVFLVSGLLSLTFATSAAEKEIYVIKDGKMVNCEFIPSVDPTIDPTIIKESKNDNGDDMVEIKNPENNYTQGLLYLPEAVDLNKTWYLEVEYYFNKDVKYSDWILKREGLVFDLMADTTALGDVVWTDTPYKNNENYRIAHVSIDCALRDFIDYDAATGDTLINKFGVGKLRSVKKYVYSSPFLPKAVSERGDANQVKAIYMSIFNEGEAETSCFIKNLKFVSEGTKPFYADKFTPLDNEGTIYMSRISNLVYGTYKGDTKLAEQIKVKNRPPFDPTKMYGQQLFLSNSDDAYYSWLNVDRLFCEMGEQRSVGFYDTEYGFLPYMKAATVDNERIDEDGIIADAALRIPLMEGTVDNTISVAMRLGHNSGYTGELTPYSDYVENSKDIRFPVEYRFESGNATKIDSKTEWMQFRPTYTKGGNDYVDSIPTLMTMVYGDVKLPSKDYNYITIRYVSNDVISYMFTDLTLTGDKETWPTTDSNYSHEKDFANYVIPVGYKLDVKDPVENPVVNNEKEFYIIKDGKMVNCEFVKADTADNEQTLIIESKNDKGEDMVEIKNPENNYTYGMLYLPEAVDLNKTWYLEVEYYFNKDAKFSIWNAKREGLTFNLMADTAAMGDVNWNSIPFRNNENYRIAHVSIDCGYRDFIDYDAAIGDTVVNRFGVGKLRTVRKYVYSSLLLPQGVAERGDANQVKAIYVSIFNEGETETSCFIKNLKFVSDGTKPFYADKFMPLSNEGTIYMSSVSNFVYGTYNDGTNIEKQVKNKKYSGISPNSLYGQQAFLSECTDPYYSYMNSDRMYCEYGEQRSVGFYDTEYGFLPYVKAATEDNERVDEDGILADAIIRIPMMDGTVDKKISIAMRLGHNAGYSGDLTPYSDYVENSKDIRFPVEYRFESGNATKIDSKTEWMQFRPTYTKGGNDYVDSIPTMMTMVYGDVELPSKEYTYITLRYVPNDVISYMFTDLTLTGDRYAWPTKTSEITLGKDFADYMIPFTAISHSAGEETSVDNVIGDVETVFYPNPASDVINVAAEGVENVSVYTVFGVLVASSDSNKVNVANLAKGVYVVKATTASGVITGQIIKK